LLFPDIPEVEKFQDLYSHFPAEHLVAGDDAAAPDTEHLPDHHYPDPTASTLDLEPPMVDGQAHTDEDLNVTVWKSAFDVKQGMLSMLCYLIITLTI